MDIGEYRLEKCKEGLFDIKVSKWKCYCPIFTIKGQEADSDEFGDQEDIDSENNSRWSCGNMVFAPKPATQTILDKYGITIDEYNEIASVLEEGLTFGRCRLCN